tara:strand:- start:15 stop:449 length:435 start_codon:yes stop_codon:yes gene_type:complete
MADIILNTENVASTDSDCIACNKTCYGLRDCVTGLIVGQSDLLAPFNGNVIQWILEQDLKNTQKVNTERAYSNLPPLPIPYECGTVESYTCYNETYDEIEFFIVNNPCVESCEACLAPPVEIEDELETGRKQKPGYDVPNCSNC